MQSCSVFPECFRNIGVLFWYEATSFLQKFLSGLQSPEEKVVKGFLVEFYKDQNVDRTYTVSFEVLLMPEVGLLQTLQCLFDRGCVFLEVFAPGP